MWASPSSLFLLKGETMIITLPSKHTRDSFPNCGADPAVHTEWSCCWHEILSFQITLPLLGIVHLN